MDITKNITIEITDEQKDRIGVEKNKDGKVLTNCYTTIDSKGKRMKVEFYGTLNIDAVARKLIEIPDSTIIRRENGELEWNKWETIRENS